MDNGTGTHLMMRFIIRVGKGLKRGFGSRAIVILNFNGILSDN